MIESLQEAQGQSAKEVARYRIVCGCGSGRAPPQPRPGLVPCSCFNASNAPIPLLFILSDPSFPFPCSPLLLLVLSLSLFHFHSFSVDLHSYPCIQPRRRFVVWLCLFPLCASLLWATIPSLPRLHCNDCRRHADSALGILRPHNHTPFTCPLQNDLCW